jgi:predicted nucleic acid-binding protein
MVFIDTNIFIYAHDNSDPLKSEIAKTLILDQVSMNRAVISFQVIQEFCNATLKESKHLLDVKDVKRVINELLMPLVAHTQNELFIQKTLDLFNSYSLSFYDAAIIQAANDLGCDIVYSEDMQNGANYDGVIVVNPFV